MSHYRGLRAQRIEKHRLAGRINQTEPIELPPLEYEPPEDFADTEATDEMPELAAWDWPMPNQPKEQQS